MKKHRNRRTDTGRKKGDDGMLTRGADLTDISFYTYGLKDEHPVFAVVGVGIVSCASLPPLPFFSLSN